MCNEPAYQTNQPTWGPVCGPAFTVKCRAGDNLALHAALTYCQEGDVLIVSNEEDTTRSLTGEVMMSYLFYTKKAAAIIIDEKKSKEAKEGLDNRDWVVKVLQSKGFDILDEKY